MFNLVYADEEGQVYDHPDLYMVARSGNSFLEPYAEEMVPLPEGATLTLIPEGVPIAMDAQGDFKLVSANPFGKGKAWAVGALLPQGYTRVLLPAYQRKGLQPLPLLGYTAVGFRDGKFYIAAKRTDKPDKWHPKFYNTKDLAKRVQKKLIQIPNNRVLSQLAKCSLDYGCFTAQNVFYERWEGGLPVSPVCNAACVGCISEQPSECCPSPQGRISFRPSLKEVVEIGVSHLTSGEEAIISFGQGCEGEPSLQADLICESITTIRSKTSKGTINLNTNAGNTEGIKQICEAGLDSMRVSVISFNEKVYNAYYRPRNYCLDNVLASLKLAKESGVYLSLNLLTFPGLTDRVSEAERLIEVIKDVGVDLVQIRNLNIDSDQLMDLVGNCEEEPLGILNLIEKMKQEIPRLAIGNFSRPTSCRD